MLTTIIIAAALAADPSILVLTTGQRLEVTSYRVDGAVVRFTTAAGEPGIMRASMIDVPASEAATEEHRAAEAAAVERAERDAAEAEAAAEQARLERDEANRKQRARTGNAAPGFSVSSVAADVPISSPSGVPASGSSNSGAASAELETLRQQWRAAADHYGQIVKEHDALVREHNGSQNFVERDIARKRIADLRAQMEQLGREAASLEGSYKRAQEAARKAGVTARDRNKAIDGGVEVAK